MKLFKRFFDFKNMRVEKRMTNAFNIVIAIASVSSIIALLSIVAVFENAMENYALPQGDIALFMNEYAESRSNTRGIIGYEDQKEIDLLVDKHDDRVKKTKERLAAIEETMVTDEGKEAYAKIEEALEYKHIVFFHEAGV